MSNAVVKNESSAVTTVEPSNILSVIERAATNPDVDIEKMERLMGMHERLMGKQAEQEFNKAMNEAQTAMGRVSADATNPQTRSQYASYAALDRALRPIYTHHGFALSFDTGEGAPDAYVRVVCYVTHSSGHSKTYHTDMPADGKGAKGGDVMTKTHAAGSAMSYGMRYLLKMIFNVAIGTDDDDGNSAAVSTITEDQIANLEALISEVGADKAAFLKVCKCAELKYMPQSMYAGAVKRLENKRSK